MIGFLYSEKRKNHQKKENPFFDFIKAKKELEDFYKKNPSLKVDRVELYSKTGITEDERQKELEKLNKK